MLLNSHQLTELLLPEQFQPLNATARIVERSNPTPRANLVDLEHDRLRAQTHGGGESKAIPNPLWWETAASLTGWFQQKTRFRQGQAMGDYALVPHPIQSTLRLLLQDKNRSWGDQSGLLTTAPAPANNASSWAVVDYQQALEALAEQLDMPEEDCAKRFGQISLSLPEKSGQGWCYHPAFGFSSNR